MKHDSRTNDAQIKKQEKGQKQIVNNQGMTPRIFWRWGGNTTFARSLSISERVFPREGPSARLTLVETCSSSNFSPCFFFNRSNRSRISLAHMNRFSLSVSKAIIADMESEYTFNTPLRIWEIYPDAMRNTTPASIARSSAQLMWGIEVVGRNG